CQSAPFDVAPGSRPALLRAGDYLVELLDLAAPDVAFSVTIRGRTVQRLALAGGDPPRIAIADTAGQLFSADASGVTPIVKFPQPITALAASPVGHRVAVGAGRTIAVFDLDGAIQVGTGALDSTAT